MDLLRLALERAATAEAAVGVITELLESVGQGGGCGHEQRGFRYHSSFLIADPTGAFVLETAGRRWAAERVTGARTISNALTIEPLASEESDRVRTFAAAARRRQACTAGRAGRASGVDDMMYVLRDHDAVDPGPDRRSAPSYSWLNGALAPCAHAGGLVVNTQTTASWVSELAPGRIAALGHRDRGAVHEPVQAGRGGRARSTLGPAPTDRDDGRSLWWRHERLHRRVLRDPRRWYPALINQVNALEERWHEARPSSADAFAEADTFLEEWTKRTAEPGPDRRPWWTRRYWAERERRAAGASLDRI